MNNYYELKTQEGTKLWVHRDQVSAMEEIPPTARTPGMLKLYVGGYAFQIRLEDKEALIKWLEEAP